MNNKEFNNQLRLRRYMISMLRKLELTKPKVIDIDAFHYSMFPFTQGA
jgi:hypothetical protein